MTAILLPLACLVLWFALVCVLLSGVVALALGVWPGVAD